MSDHIGCDMSIMLNFLQSSAQCVTTSSVYIYILCSAMSGLECE